MERFGSEEGSAFNMHEIEHISIAILYAFGGTFGLLLESKFIRSLLVKAIPGENSSLLRYFFQSRTGSHRRTYRCYHGRSSPKLSI